MRKETDEQKDLAAWLDMQPGLTWCHVPNEGKKAVNYHSRMKKEGLKSGVPDVLIFTPPPLNPNGERLVGTAVELKRVKGGKTSSEQEKWLDNLAALGWRCRVCAGALEAIEWLMSLGYGRGM